MIKKTIPFAVLLLLISSCTTEVQKEILPIVPDGAQAISLSGKSLFPVEPDSATVEKFLKAKKEYEANSTDPDLIIWYGRWTAYKGDYRDAVQIYSEGIEKFPDDPRMYRHRGHRYISVREFDRAIEDFETAARLIEGKEDKIEPDGRPNALNIPVSTLHTNIWYHLALAYYLKNDLNNALRAGQKGIEASTNNDMLVAMTHWIYMSYRSLGKEEEAKLSVEAIKPEMEIIENQTYHQLCLLYKGGISIDQMSGEGYSDIMNDAMLYGIGNWYHYNGDKEKAREIFVKILKGNVWASFGYVAAEANLYWESN